MVVFSPPQPSAAQGCSFPIKSLADCSLQHLLLGPSNSTTSSGFVHAKDQ